MVSLFLETLEVLANLERFSRHEKTGSCFKMFLNSSQIFSQKGQKIFLSEIMYLILRKLFKYFLNLRTYFSNQGNISQ